MSSFFFYPAMGTEGRGSFVSAGSISIVGNVFRNCRLIAATLPEEVL